MRSKHPSFVNLIVIVAGVACWGGPVPLRAAESEDNAQPSAFQGNPRYTPVVDLVKRVRGAVVNIHSERSARARGGNELFALAPSRNRVNGMGTGIIIDPRGYVVTNHHVVEDVSALRVRLADGTTSPARVVARDAENDLALLKIDVKKPLPVIPVGTASDLMVGETVVAIGNAYGYDHTVTVGVVSAIQRDVTLNKEISYKDLIQTDASINPGNSGGPLLNVKGELIGVNVAIRAGAQGIGFAIPVDTMLGVAADMMSAARRDLSHGLVCRDRVETKDGRIVLRELVVDSVEANSPAARAGVQRGDVVTRIGGQEVHCRLDLERMLFERAAKEPFGLVVRRDGRERKVELALEPARRAAPSAAELVWRKFGLRLERVGNEAVVRANQQLHGGLIVADVRDDGAAARAGIQRGDILVGLHQWEMLSLDNVVYVLTHPERENFNPVRFYIIRAGQVHRGWLRSGE